MMPSQQQPSYTRARRRMLPVILAAVAALVATTVAVVLLVRSDDTIRAAGVVVLTGEQLVFQGPAGACTPSARFADVVAGARLRIDVDGETVALVPLGPAERNGAECQLPWRADVPAGRPAYGFSLDGRDRVEVSEAEVRAGLRLSFG